MRSLRLIGVTVGAMAEWLVLLGNGVGDSGAARLLHPHLIGLVWYVATEVEQQKRKGGKSKRGQGVMESKRLTD